MHNLCHISTQKFDKPNYASFLGSNQAIIFESYLLSHKNLFKGNELFVPFRSNFFSALSYMTQREFCFCKCGFLRKIQLDI